MNIGVYVQYDSAFESVSNLTLPVLQDYCRRHGYSLQVSKNPPITRSVIWDRVKVWIENAHKHDWLVHFDSDVLITNPEVRLEYLFPVGKFNFMVSEDRTFHPDGINDGVFFIRGTEASVDVLRRMWESVSVDRVFCGQDALLHLIRSDESVRGMVKVVPQTMFNSYLYQEYGFQEDHEGNWKKGDFVLHLPGCSNERRCQIFSKLIHENT